MTWQHDKCIQSDYYRYYKIMKKYIISSIPTSYQTLLLYYQLSHHQLLQHKRRKKIQKNIEFLLQYVVGNS